MYVDKDIDFRHACFIFMSSLQNMYCICPLWYTLAFVCFTMKATFLVYLETLEVLDGGPVLCPLCSGHVMMVHVIELLQGPGHNIVVIVAHVLESCKSFSVCL